MRILLAITFLMTLSAFQANAELKVKDYQKFRASSDPNTSAITKFYLNGLGEGLEWANAAVGRAKQPKLYCQPEKLILQSENYTDIIDAQIKKMAALLTQAELSETLVGALLLRGLQETFPCSGK